MEPEEIIARIVIGFIACYLAWCLAFWSWAPFGSDFFHRLGAMPIADRCAAMIFVTIMVKQEKNK